MTTELIVVRHGETVFNARGIYQGQADSPLTATGEAQARALAPRIRGLGSCPALYCSDLARARRTAELIHTPGHHEVTPEPALRERAYGDFEGRPVDEVRAAIPPGDPDYAAPGGGESQRELHERVVAAFDAIAARHPGERVVAVSHGGVLIAFARYALGLPLTASRRFHIHNTSLSFFRRDDGGWSVRTLGDLAHLEAGFAGEGGAGPSP